MATVRILMLMIFQKDQKEATTIIRPRKRHQIHGTASDSFEPDEAFLLWSFSYYICISNSKYVCPKLSSIHAWIYVWHCNIYPQSLFIGGMKCQHWRSHHKWRVHAQIYLTCQNNEKTGIQLICWLMFFFAYIYLHHSKEPSILPSHAATELPSGSCNEGSLPPHPKWRSEPVGRHQWSLWRTEVRAESSAAERSSCLPHCAAGDPTLRTHQPLSYHCCSCCRRSPSRQPHQNPGGECR